MNYAIILSGGKGTRLGGDVPKQYIEINGKAILQYVIETIESCDAIDGFIIVAEKGWRQTIDKMISEKDKMKGYAEAGITRQVSIYNGLIKLEDIAEFNDQILITDAARPNISNKLIENCVSFDDNYDGVMPVIPLKDTVYISNSGIEIEGLIDRKVLFAGQTPECFKYGKYLEANKRLMPNEILKINGSSEAAYKSGMKIQMIDGNENNYKITTASDLEKFKNQIEAKL